MRVRRDVAARLWRGWLVLFALALSAFGFSVALAARRAMAEHRDRGAAIRTTLLPPSASPATAAPSTGNDPVAAQPFSLARAGAVDRARALQCLADAVYYEAGSEPDAGQRAVAQVVLNRVRHPAFPATVCGVVYQGAPARGCQFSFACDGAMVRVPSQAGWARAARVAAAALAGEVYAPVGLATHYHTYAVTPGWNRALVMTDVEGAHFFHRWKGFWGTAAAFRQAYTGGEPLPAPRTTPVASVPSTTKEDGHVETGVTIAIPPDTDHLPPAPTMLPRWEGSGQPL